MHTRAGHAMNLTTPIRKQRLAADYYTTNGPSTSSSTCQLSAPQTSSTAPARVANYNDFNSIIRKLSASFN
jgi:hypothetical protein